MLRNHGLPTCGATAAAAFTTLYTLETACKVHVDVIGMGTEWLEPDVEAIARTAAVGGAAGLSGETEWAAVRRLLDRLDPSYPT